MNKDRSKIKNQKSNVKNENLSVIPENFGTQWRNLLGINYFNVKNINNKLK